MIMEPGPVQSISGRSIHSSALKGLRSLSTTMDPNAVRVAQGDISAKRFVPLNQQMFIYSINRHLLRIANQVAGEVLETKG